ncbi:ABC transporter substrate-binding protein [Hyella patelloides LEGE 07179]|uniref:ABC transporter substrate-binding protein n=1 Tax=Hyella patelloides LEGE 07179 TaxID=945734 RepID=A0A563W4B2_9CYAN|nr:ABC transporter substrate-binding protein [Hyella patelloides]VEP18505.1 ABC transporter substrate-binding protein [Hyella patelloides LEGE 07179]
MIKKRLSYCALAIAISLLAIACNSNTELTTTRVAPVSLSTEENVLQLWWDKGYNPEEDEALKKLVKNWEQETGNKVQINFYTLDKRSEKPQRFLQGGITPDIFISFKAESTLNPSLAWEGKLIDVSDIVEPVKEIYDSGALETAYYYNNVTKKGSYYAVPIHRGALHLYYWKDLLEKTGRTEADIPQDWDGFWQFWLDVGEDLRTKHQQDIYPIGLPMSVEAGDTYQAFEHVLEAYNVKIVDAEGNLLVDDPQVRQGIINCLDWYTKFYLQGSVPQNAVNWNNAANNRLFLNQEILTTTNASLSIPAALRHDPDAYRNKLGIVELPNKPNGEPMRHIFLVEQAVIFHDATNPEVAKDFLTYLTKLEVINNFLKESGRHSPAHKSAYKDPYWTNPNDPHTSEVTKTLTKSKIRPIYPTNSPAYSIVLKENIWGQSLENIVLNNVTPEQAADKAIARIKEIFAEWEN